MTLLLSHAKIEGIIVNKVYTAISRKVVGENAQATISKGNMGYGQYTLPDSIAVEATFVAFLLLPLTNVYDLSCNSFTFLWRTVNSTSFLEIAVVASVCFSV